VTAIAPAAIRLLPEHLIDQIKAGEVIERSANVLKELLENAIDAGASSIDVEIRENGLNLLRVSDDGHGIKSADLPLAFGRHATSKIQSFEDIYRLTTFGFRGEALPSIASISRLECVSWTKAEAQGGMLQFEGGAQGQVLTVQKSGRDHGTVMTVKDLFYNTPARLKFLQSPTSERNWLKKYFYAFALANPLISFSLLWDDEERLFYPAAPDHATRVRQLHATRAREKIKIQEARRSWHGLECLVLTVQNFGARSDGPLEHVWVNGRPILDKAYGRIVQQTFERAGLLEHPQTLIYLTLPGDQLDVNVHPNKTLVKFHQSSEVLSLAAATLRETLETTSTGEASLERELPLASPTFRPALDLERDRAESYASHLQRMTMPAEETALATSTGELRSLYHAPGPYFLWQLPEVTHPIFFDGQRLISEWIKEKMNSGASSTPLLVSHPLRGMSLSAMELEKFQQLGLEIDELEKDFFVVREIPQWARGLPVPVVLHFMLKKPGPVVFGYEEISQSKWEEIVRTQTCQQWEQLDACRPLSSELFRP
jgi:DNA mismatch repair protein MutL